MDINLPMNRKKNSGICVLWLDVCEEPGLSRLCIAPKQIFELPKEYEDERMAYGVFLSDIAEVRRGISSHAFSLLPRHGLHSTENEKGWLRAEQCVSIVASERTLAFQFLSTVTLSSRPQKTSSRLHVKSGSDIHRLLFLDMLSLLICQSMAPEELQFRNRHLMRYLVHPSLRTFPQHFADKKMQIAGKKTADLLIQGIDIDVEIHGNSFGRNMLHGNHQDANRAVNRFLRYDAAQNALVVSGGEDGNSTGSSNGNSNGNSVATSQEGTGAAGESVRGDQLLTNIAEEEEDDGDGDREEEEDTSGEEEDEDGEGEPSDSVSVAFTAENIHQHWWFTGTHVWSENNSGWETLYPQQKKDGKKKEIVIPLDDLSEIRPGKVSSLIDSPDDLHSCISFVTSYVTLVLPLGNIQLRNTLLPKFQSFLMVSHPKYLIHLLP